MDAEALLKPVSADQPAGPDLSGDNAMAALEAAGPGTPRREVGGSVIPAREPPWRDVARMAEGLLARSKDLRVALWAALADLRTAGLPGFADGMALLRGLHERYWDTYYPLLADNDPSERMGLLSSLGCPMWTDGDPHQFVWRLHEAPLVVHERLGKVSYKDLLIARGDLEIPADPDAPAPPDKTAIARFIEQATLADFEAPRAGVRAAADHLAALTAFLNAKVGKTAAPSFEPLERTLAGIGRVLDEEMARKGGAPVAAAGDPSGSAGGGAEGGPRASGEIAGRADVVLALDRIIDYYGRHEVSSPVPIVLRAAKQLVGKGFLEISRILDPDAIKMLEKISSPPEGDATR